MLVAVVVDVIQVLAQELAVLVAVVMAGHGEVLVQMEQPILVAVVVVHLAVILLEEMEALAS